MRMFRRHPVRGSDHGSAIHVWIELVDHASRLLERSTASVRITTPQMNRPSACGHSVSRPTPFRKIPRRMMTKYRRGIRYVRGWIHDGMFSIGNTKPERYIIGVMKKKVDVIIACCWVLEIVEMNRPSPRVVSRYTRLMATNSQKLPRSGTLNQTTRTVKTT